MLTLILTTALLSQAPGPRYTEEQLAAQTASLKRDIQARAAARAKEARARQAAMTPAAKALRAQAWEAARYRRTVAEHEARLSRAAQASAAQEAQARADQAARAQAERLIPYQLEAQRQAFRQQAELELLRLEAERNRILDQGINRIYRGQYVPPQTQAMWWAR